MPDSDLTKNPPNPRSVRFGAGPHAPCRHGGESGVTTLEANDVRYAAIDIGSNSVRLEVAERVGDGGYCVLAEDRAHTRLGSELAATRTLDRQAVEKTLEALKRFVATMRDYQVARMRTIATSAVREASNGADFCRQIQREVGLEVEVVSAEQEAALAFLSVQQAFDIAERNVAVVDVGGGSTEIAIAARGMIQQVIGTPLGAVRLTERFRMSPRSRAIASPMIDLDAMGNWIDAEIHATIPPPVLPLDAMYGSGGTFTALAAIHQKVAKLPMGAFTLDGGDHPIPQRGSEEANMNQHFSRRNGRALAGYCLMQSDLSQILGMLSDLPTKERAKVPGLASDRVEIIPAGLMVVERIMRRLQLPKLIVHTGGLRDGMILEMLR